MSYSGAEITYFSPDAHIFTVFNFSAFSIVIMERASILKL